MRELCLAESAGRVLHRSREYGQIFTPTELVLEILEQMPRIGQDGATVLDPTCGNGQMLAPVAIIKRELGHKEVLSSIYGVDLLLENVKQTRQRLLAIAGDTEANQAIVQRNIRMADALTFDFSFV